ncbi:MAG: hypothetical protein M0Q13_15710 [Methanothrix sp.]|jgi:hypothetical protein|nr:hypothetical protein [Methanothrix sp.]
MSRIIKQKTINKIISEVIMKHIVFTKDEELKDLLFNKIEEQECKLITMSYPKCTKKSRIDKELFESVFSDEIVCISIRNVIIGANYRELLKRYATTDVSIESENKPIELPWGEWVNNTNILITHKNNYYLRVYSVDKNCKKYYIYSNGSDIEKEKFKKLDEFLPLEKENDNEQKVIVNNIKLSNINTIEFKDKKIERIFK